MISPFAWRIAFFQARFQSFEQRLSTLRRFHDFPLFNASPPDCGTLVTFREPLEDLLLIGSQVRLLGLIVDVHQEDDVGLGDVQVDHPGPTPLPLATSWVGHPHFPEAAATRHDRARLRVIQQLSLKIGKASSDMYSLTHSVNSLVSTNVFFILSYVVG